MEFKVWGLRVQGVNGTEGFGVPKNVKYILEKRMRKEMRFGIQGLGFGI